MSENWFCFCSDKAETQMIASALSRLPIRTIWKMSKQEVAAVGGLDALNLTENVKVRLFSALVSLHVTAACKQTSNLTVSSASFSSMAVCCKGAE